jgi:hypothetical protein
MRRTIRIIPALLAFCAACGHADANPSSPASVALEKSTFADLFSLSRTIELEQPDTAPIVRLSGIDRAEDGRLLVGDVSEGNVKLFAPDGRLLKIIGRKGEGPGEFTAPRYPRFGPDGLIYVADAQNPRVQVFDAAGRLLRATRIDGFSLLEGFVPLSNGNYLLAVHRESDPRVLAEVEPGGRVVREMLPIGKVRPAGQPDHTLWKNVRTVFMDVAGDTAYVSNSLSDTIWAVHLASGEVERTHLSLPPEYVRPAPPREPPPDIAGLMAWTRSFHVASVVTATGHGGLVVPYVKGVLNHGDPMLLATRDRLGRWRVAHDAPPVIGGGGNEVIAILTPGEEQVRLGIYTRR